MADNVLIVGLSTGPIWGCPDTDYGAGQSFDVSTGSEVKTLEGGDGNPIAAAFYKEETQLSFSAKIKGTVPTDPPGTVLTVGTEKGYLKQIKTNKKTGDFADISIELVRWKSITIPAT